MTDDLDDLRDEQGMDETDSEFEREAAYESTLDRKRQRHPGDFYGDWPSDEQLSYFVRGGR